MLFSLEERRSSVNFQMKNRGNIFFSSTPFLFLGIWLFWVNPCFRPHIFCSQNFSFQEVSFTQDHHTAATQGNNCGKLFKCSHCDRNHSHGVNTDHGHGKPFQACLFLMRISNFKMLLICLCLRVSGSVCSRTTVNRYQY